MLFFLILFLTLFLILFWLSSFLFPEIINQEKKKQNQINPTIKSLFLVDRFSFYFEAISLWDHAIALLLAKFLLKFYRQLIRKYRIEKYQQFK